MIGTLFVGAAMNAKSASATERGPLDRLKSVPAGAGSRPTTNDTRETSPSMARPEDARTKGGHEQSADDGGALLERAQAGDLAAYGELVRRYQSRVVTVAYGILRNREDAEDVVQEGFLKAYRNLNNFRGQSSFYTWLYRIVFNLSIDLSRKKYRRTEVNSGDSLQVDAHLARNATERGGSGTGDVIIGRMAGPDEELSRGELRGKINQAMESLSDDHRSVIMLREVDGLSYAEIADVVGCTKGTVMSRLHHARRRLQKILADFAPVGAGKASDSRQMAEETEGDDAPSVAAVK